MDSLRRVVHALRVANRASERSTGLGTAQLFVLRQLALAPGQSLSALAARTRTTPSSISELVTRLVRRGLVARALSKDDRRRVELRLTTAGHDALTRVPETIQERLLRGFDALGPTDGKALADRLEAWLAASGLGDVSPTMFFEDSPAEGHSERRMSS